MKRRRSGWSLSIPRPHTHATQATQGVHSGSHADRTLLIPVRSVYRLETSLGATQQLGH